MSRGGVFHIANTWSDATRLTVGQISPDTVIRQPGLLPLYLAIYSTAALLLIRNLKQVLIVVRREKFTVVVVLLAILSTAWSVLPLNTIAKAVALCGSTVVATYIAISFDKEQQLQLLIQATVLLMMSSIALAVIMPETGRMQGNHSGLWQGVFLHKNELGRIMCIGAVSCFIGASGVLKSKMAPLYWLGFTGCLLTMLMSGSKSAQIVFVACLSLASAAMLYRRQWRFPMVAALSIALTLATLWMQVRQHVFLSHATESIATIILEPATGKEAQSATTDNALAPPSVSDKTIEGRLRLWRQLFGFVMDRPLLGHGLGAFWQGKSGPSGEVMKQQSWYPFHAHNGFLDLWLELGLIGLAVFLLGFIATAVSSVTTLPANPTDLFYPLLLLQVFLFNLSNSGLVTGNHLLWVIYAMVALSLTVRPARSSLESTAAIDVK